MTRGEAERMAQRLEREAGWQDVTAWNVGGSKWAIEGVNAQGEVEYRDRFEPHRCLGGLAAELALHQLYVLEAIMREVKR